MNHHHSVLEVDGVGASEDTVTIETTTIGTMDMVIWIIPREIREMMIIGERIIMIGMNGLRGQVRDISDAFLTWE